MSLMNFFVKPIAVILILMMTGCKKEFEATKADDIPLDSIIVSYLDMNGILDFRRENQSGIYLYPSTSLNPTNRSLSDGRVIYFRYELAVFNSSDTTLSSPFLALSTQSQSTVAAHGANAIYPVGLDLALAESEIHEGDTLNMVLPADYAYGSFSLSASVPANATLHITIVLDSVKTENEVRSAQIQQINQYVIASNLNDTAQFQGSFVTSILSGSARFKLLGDTLLTANPVNGDLLSIVYTLSDLDSAILDNQYATTPFQFTLNEEPIAEFMEEGLKITRNGETVIIIASSDVAYKESACIIPDISFRSTFDAFFDHLIEDEIVPDYVLRVKPYTPLLVQTHLISIN